MAIIAENWRIVKWLGGAILADYFLVFYAMVHGLGFWQYPYGYRCKGTAGETGEQNSEQYYSHTGILLHVLSFCRLSWE
jgi:hypothetical protein